MGKQKYRHHPELVRMYAQKEEMMPTIDQRTQIDDSSSYSKHPAAHVPGDNIKLTSPNRNMRRLLPTHANRGVVWSLSITIHRVVCVSCTSYYFPIRVIMPYLRTASSAPTRLRFSFDPFLHKQLLFLLLLVIALELDRCRIPPSL